MISEAQQIEEEILMVDEGEVCVVVVVAGLEEGREVHGHHEGSLLDLAHLGHQ